MINNYALMFHHFHGEGHHCGQGSISATKFAQIIEFIGRDNILDGSEWIDAYLNNSLDSNAVCLTFDDALKCQIDIALPVLNEYKIKALFFVYSSVFEGVAEKLEIYRYYRTVYFNSVDEFYNQFKARLYESQYANKITENLPKFDNQEYLSAFPFYSRSDKEFRYIRDKILGPEVYYEVMDAMIKEAGLELNELRDFLWMTDQHLLQLVQEGHEIGLHSYSHPTNISELSKQNQFCEYNKNAAHLKSVLGQVPRSASYPCGSYNLDSIDILKSLGVKIGFRSNMKVVNNRLGLEIAREDHANILQSMQKTTQKMV